MESTVMPLECWMCDVCARTIESVGEGYVVWRVEDDHENRDFKIIHKGRCDPRGPYAFSLPLKDFLGADGLTQLLSFFSAGPLIGRDNDLCRIKDLHTFVDFVRRVQTPWYEEAREHFNHPDVIAEYRPFNEFVPYTTEVLKHIALRFADPESQ